MKDGKAIGVMVLLAVGAYALSKAKPVIGGITLPTEQSKEALATGYVPPAIREITLPLVKPPVIPPPADVQVIAVLGRQPTASVQELDIVEQTYGRESEAYQATIDIAFEAAQTVAEATGGVVSWSSDDGYQAISHEEAYSYGYYDYW